MRRPLDVCLCLLLLAKFGHAEHFDYSDFETLKRVYQKMMATDICSPANRPDACVWMKSQVKQQIEEAFGESDSKVTGWQRTFREFGKPINNPSQSAHTSEEYSDGYFFGPKTQEIYYVIDINTTINARKAVIETNFKRRSLSFHLLVNDETPTHDYFSDWDFWLSDSSMVTAEKREVVYDNEIYVSLLLHNVTLHRSGYFLDSVSIDSSYDDDGVEVNMRGLEKSRFVKTNSLKAFKKKTQKGKEAQKSLRRQLFDGLLNTSEWLKPWRDEWVNASGVAARNEVDAQRKEDTIVALEATCGLYLKMSTKRRVTAEVDAFDSPL